ncbi:MAG: hypothetical protein M1308_10755 [Actinobacteria bacterium]|nr:hypothetical protein [Actinomycetota bacterium]
MNRFVLYLPNVFASVVIGFIGIIIANIAHEAVQNASSGLGSRVQSILAGLTRYSIIFFTALIALNQLGISPNLIQILLTGLVAVMAIAIGLGLGLSIGLGGREKVRETLDSLVDTSSLTGVKGGRVRRNEKSKSAKNNRSEDKESEEIS